MLENSKDILSNDELYMIHMATGGPVFDYTKNRDIPVLEDWSTDEALDFEKTINSWHKNNFLNLSISSLSNKQISYLKKIHYDNMMELQSDDYEIIIGVPYEKAEYLLQKIESFL